MDASFLETATAGLNSAAVILLTIICVTLRDIDRRLRTQERKAEKVFDRVQRLSVGAGLQELDLD